MSHSVDFFVVSRNYNGQNSAGGRGGESDL